MRIGLVSDTHDNLTLTRVVAQWLRDDTPELVIHLGDITTAECAALFVGLPVIFLRGNNDLSDELRDGLVERGLPPLLDTWASQFDGTRIAATHGHARNAVERLAREHDIVAHGHTHRLRCERIGKAVVINPGALHRAPVKTVAMLDVPTRNVDFYEVSASGVLPRH